MLTPPVISLRDAPTESEGSIDPLSLATTYERLADRILPAVTVRMGRIRFMTAMCLGAHVCRDMRDDFARDEVTPAWLVFEWFVIKAFAETDEDPIGQRIPGLLKVRTSLGNKREVSAPSYLKTPKVFGFSGIFRRLATRAKLLTNDLELDGGEELLAAWAHDQKLDGLFENRGAGHDLVKDLRKTVVKGMAAGHTVPQPRAFWDRIATLLHPDDIGRRERSVLHARLRETHALTAEHVDALVAHGANVPREDEAAYLRKRARTSSPELATHLTAIEAYEGVCRPLIDAFDLIRVLSTDRGGGPVDAADFAAHEHAKALVAALRKASTVAETHPTLLGWQPEVQALLGHFGHVRTARELFEAVVDHHKRAQDEKPPNGKRPWLERARGESYMVRIGYKLEARTTPPNPYPHDYRTATLSRFLRDLKQHR